MWLRITLTQIELIPDVSQKHTVFMEYIRLLESVMVWPKTIIVIVALCEDLKGHKGQFDTIYRIVFILGTMANK